MSWNKSEVEYKLKVGRDLTRERLYRDLYCDVCVSWP